MNALNSWQAMVEDEEVFWVTDRNGNEERSQHEPQTSWMERVKEGFLMVLPGAQYY